MSRSNAALETVNASRSAVEKSQDVEDKRRVALRFVDAVERTVDRIGRSPHSGDLRLSYELGIPDLRTSPLARFPSLMFYVVGDEAVDVWRVLHTRRDLPGAMSDDSGT